MTKVTEKRIHRKGAENTESERRIGNQALLNCGLPDRLPRRSSPGAPVAIRYRHALRVEERNRIRTEDLKDHEELVLRVGRSPPRRPVIFEIY